MSGGAEPGHWSQLAERGGALGLRIVLACYRLFGERAARWLLYPVVGYFFLTGREARSASLDFLRRVHARRGDFTPVPGWRESFRHMLCFGQSALDKLAAWTGAIDRQSVDFPEPAAFDRLMRSGQGAVLIGSHLGNLEMIRALVLDPRLPLARRPKINAVVYTDHALRFNELMRRVNADFDLNLIQIARLGPDTAIRLKEKIERGEMIVIVGDRTPPRGHAENRVDAVDFLGAPALFAQGPFILANLLDCPVYLLFCVRRGARYRIDAELFAERVVLPRRDREASLRAYMRKYAARLEHYCLEAPEQWFNFYDFWRRDSALPDREA